MISNQGGRSPLDFGSALIFPLLRVSAATNKCLQPFV
jgi:hypothetical protein